MGNSPNRSVEGVICQDKEWCYVGGSKIKEDGEPVCVAGEASFFHVLIPADFQQKETKCLHELGNDPDFSLSQLLG